MFRYRLVTGLLVLGVFFGFGSGIASVVHHAHGGGCHSSWRDRRDERLAHLERRFARACVDAARIGAPGAAQQQAAATPGPSAGYYAAPQWGPPPGWAYAAPWAVAPGYAPPPAALAPAPAAIPAPAPAIAPPAQP